MSLPAKIQSVLDLVPAEIGAQRAIIALQGLVSAMRPIRFIDGEIRQETLDAIAAAVTLVGEDRLAQMFRDKLDQRFPEQMPKAEQPVEDDAVAVAPVKPRRKRGA